MLKPIVVMASVLLAFPLTTFAENSPKSQIASIFEAAPSVGIITPIFSQLVMMSYPKTFRPVKEDVSGIMYLQESVPEGQTKDKWSEMITITGAKDLALNPKITLDAVANSFAQGFKKDCPDSFQAARLSEDAKYSNYDAFVAVVSCGTSVPTGTPYSESTLLIIVKGEKDVYTIQWAERGEGSKTPLNLDANKWNEKLKALSPIKICNRVPKEKPPYQSCIDQK